MDKRINDGGPAFPVHDTNTLHTDYGMTLRDWFAGQALTVAWDARDKGYFESDDRGMADCAYQVADAMLAAREGGAE